MSTAIQFLTQQPTALKILFPIGLLLGIALVLGAIVDPSGFFAKWYEDNKNWKVGLWAVSRTARQFRAWHIVLGLGFIAITIAGMTVVF